MATITEVTICNSALIKLGADRISSLNEDNKRAALCKEQYPKNRDDLLLLHPWNFAITRIELALVSSEVYDPGFEFEKVFAIPNDVLRILKTNLNLSQSRSAMGFSTGEVRWAVETDPSTNAKYLLTNVDAVKIKYIKKVPEAFFTPTFAEVLALKLAQDISYAINQSASITQLMAQFFEGKFAEARSFDAQEGSVPQVEADEFLLARI